MFLVFLVAVQNFLIESVMNDGNLCFDVSLNILSGCCKNAKPDTSDLFLV